MKRLSTLDISTAVAGEVQPKKSLMPRKIIPSAKVVAVLCRQSWGDNLTILEMQESHIWGVGFLQGMRAYPRHLWRLSGSF